VTSALLWLSPYHPFASVFVFAGRVCVVFPAASVRAIKSDIYGLLRLYTARFLLIFDVAAFVLAVGYCLLSASVV
jgi:hypothetical protein